MKNTFVLSAILLLSSICQAMPQLVFTIADNEYGQKVIQSAGKMPGAEYALGLDQFLGQRVEEGFSFFGETNAEKTMESINKTLADETNCDFVYTNPKDGKDYEANFMKMINSDGSLSVNIFITQK